MHADARKPLVFVVDDEASIAQTAAMILSAHGYNARAFTDAHAALQACRSEAPNLLLTDVIMPGLNGYELSAGVVEDCPRCKVILFSGNPAARDYYAKTAGERSLEVLLKPVRPSHLVDAVRVKLQQ